MSSGLEPSEEPSANRDPKDAAVRQALVESHQDLARFLQRRLGNADEAEDVLQRFILKAIERSEDLRDVKAVRGWLSRVLATTIFDHQRAAARRRKREQLADPAKIAEMDETAIEPDMEIDEAICHCLYKLLPTLKPEYAQLIWRVDLLGEARKTVAQEIGVSANNLTVRLHRARQALKQRLEDLCRICAIHGFMDCGCENAGQLGQP